MATCGLQGDTGISNIMHELINNVCASKGFTLLLYSVNSFSTMPKQIALKNEIHSVKYNFSLI